MEKFNCWLPTWDELHKKIREVGKKIKKDNYHPDIVVAISRGGFVPARVICDLLIIKDLVSVKVDHWGITASKDGKAKLRYPLNTDLTGKKVLIVDDITDTGESMRITKEFVEKLNPDEIRTAAALHIKTSKFKPDYYGDEIDWKWVIFPWNYVEDMCNILPKVLDNKGISIQEIKKRLKENFKIDVSEEDIIEILGELVVRNAVTEKSEGWVKTKTD